jgi:class 3 adenylate cyclase/pimeloyl-ACP methyl ester carboxylesterase
MTEVPKTHWATTVDGASIAYQILGGGPQTLVVIHPWASHLEVYWEQPRFARFMRRLARDLRVVHMDKRGMGMSDRIYGTPDVSLLMDDVRAVMDASGTERAAVFGWGGTGGAPLAALFAATYPERTSALLIDGQLHERHETDNPDGLTDEMDEEWSQAYIEVWGDDDHLMECAQWCFGDRPEDCPTNDLQFLRWWTKMMRYSCTPTGMVAFGHMWHVTDIRPALPTIHVPTAVFCKSGAASGVGPDVDQRRWAAFNVEHIPGAKSIEVPGAAHVIWIEEPEPYVSALERFLWSVEEEQATLARSLATVLFTDIVGSTQRAVELGDTQWKALLERHNLTVRAMLARYRGSEVSTAGDGFLATFDGPARAVKCAQGICEAVKPLGLEVRAGCHTGEIELMGEGGADVGGIAVHVGARVGALAGPSEVLVSSTVKDLVAGSGLVFEDRGKHELKGVPDPWHLYAVAS